MKPSRLQPPRPVVAWLIGLVLAETAWHLQARPGGGPGGQPPIQASLIDQLPPQGNGPSFRGLDERRRGPIFNAALQQVVHAGRLPPVTLINPDLTLPATVADEPKLPPGTRLLRIYLTQWSESRLGGIADTEILCRFFVEVRRDGRVEKKLGPFFVRKPLDTLTAETPQDRWVQFQAAAKLAIEQMAAALGSSR